MLYNTGLEAAKNLGSLCSRPLIPSFDLPTILPVRPDDYHLILMALDQALAVFGRCKQDWTDDDRELLKRLEIIRSQVLKAESGHPFPLRPRTEPVAGAHLTDLTLDAAVQPSSDSTSPVPKRIRVVIADDHDTVRSIVRTLLTMEGDFEVVGEAINGREAVNLAQIYRPDIIIMDMTMPTLDGISATREVLQILPETKILIFSANQDPAASRAALAAGAVGFINKPTSRKLLITAMRDAVRIKSAPVPA